MTDLDRIEEVARAGESLDVPTTLALIAELRALREALKPFGEFFEWAVKHEWPKAISEDDHTPVIGIENYDGKPSCVITVGDFRSAHKALSYTPQPDPRDAEIERLKAENKRLVGYVQGLDTELCMAIEALNKRGADQYIKNNYPHWKPGTVSSFSSGCPTARKALGDHQ